MKNCWCNISAMLFVVCCLPSAAWADEPQLRADVPVVDLSTNIAPPIGDLPENVAAEVFRAEGVFEHLPGTSRHWAPSGLEWEASGLKHEPLIFEEVMLERTGYNFGWAQPGISAVHFFGRIPLVPYLYVADGGKNCTYTLGNYRPGSCAPFVIQKTPFDLEAALTQGGLTTMMFFVIP